MTAADWSNDAESSSFHIILETMEVTVRTGNENVRESSDNDSVL
jgi:hypothetical protein